MERKLIKKERAFCNTVGLTLAFMIFWSFIWSLGMNLLVHGNILNANSGLYYLLSLTGNYAVSLPVAFLMLKDLPSPPLITQKQSAKTYLVWIIIGIALMEFFALVGNAANNMIYSILGRQPTNLVQDVFDSMPLGIILVCACILGPIMEEILFRGLIARKLSRYGESAAALVSGLLFGLFHATVTQFFYAAALGVLLAYAYFKTGRLIVPILLHMAFNIWGSGIPMLIEHNMILMFIYAFLLLVLTVGGILLFFFNRKNIVWRKGSQTASYKIIFGNFGMIVAVLLCFAEFITVFVKI